jgi:EAL domain-containing protein (putative c-di-GMP-specific phosphodiesterase class I)
LLDLEITEGMIMHRADQAVAVLERLHKLGVRLSVDDFGTGYSSLSYLKRFPVQTLKIDRSFVNGLTADGDDGSIVTAIVAMAKSLKLEVIAEGVETPDQLAFLARLHCDKYQGYLFSRPIPANDCIRLLERSARIAAVASCEQ